MGNRELDGIGQRVNDLARIKELINNLRGYASQTETFSKMLAASAEGAELISLSQRLGVLPLCKTGVDDVERWLASVNVALVVECARFIMVSTGPVLRAERARPRSPYKHAYPLLVDIIVTQSGMNLLMIIASICMDQSLLSQHGDKKSPLLSWLSKMFNQEYQHDFSAPLGKNVATTGWDLCLDLFHQRREFDHVDGWLLPGMKDEYVWLVECVNEAIEQFRHYARQRRSAINRWVTPVEKRHQKGVRVLQSMWRAEVAQLLFVRLDLGSQPGRDATALFWLRDRFVEFQNKIRFKSLIFKRLLGVLWRLVRAGDETWHYHCLFVLDGSLVGKNDQHGQLIGEYWLSMLPKGQGWFFDYARHPCRVVREETGVFDPMDRNARDIAFTRILPFFTQFDLYVRPGSPHQFSWEKYAWRSLRLFGYRLFGVHGDDARAFEVNFYENN